MSVISFEEKYCKRIRVLLDSHLNSELPPEVAAEVERHVESCGICFQTLEASRRVKEGLQRAVLRQEEMPAGLEERLRRSTKGSVFHSAQWMRGSFALAASLLLALAGWAIVRSVRLNSAQTQSALKIGIDDHIHCALNRPYPSEPQSIESMEHDLGADFIGLVPLVKAQVPGDFTIKAAHRCTFHGRKFVHLILTEPGTTLSVLLTPKDGESFGRGGTLHQARLQNLSVAGFQTGQYLAYVVSDLDATANSRIAAVLVPTVRQFVASKG